MNNLLYRTMDNNTPKFNKDVTEGTAKRILELTPEYLNNIFMDSIKSLDKSVDLQYLGYRYVTPEEEVNKLILGKDKGIIYDISKNDIFLIELRFTYMGKPISKYLYLPYCDRGNLIKFSDTTYHIVPVLSDSVISPSFKEVFVRLLKAKLSFKSTARNFIVDGIKIPGNVIHSQILRVNTPQIVDNIGKPLVATATYLAAERGLVNAIKFYGKTDDVIVTVDNVDHLRENYMVYESTKVKPRGLKVYNYKGHDIKICVSKKCTNTTFINNFIFGIIYTLDILPEYSIELNEYIVKDDLTNEIMLWKMLIGRTSYKNTFSVNRMYGDVVEHFNNLDGYIDTLIKEKLKQNGKNINNFFELLATILTNYNEWLNNSKAYNSSIDNRYIDILYYLMYDIIVGFNKVILNINKRVSKKPLSEKEAITILNDELPTKKILNLTKSTSVNLCINQASD